MYTTHRGLLLTVEKATDSTITVSTVNVFNHRSQMTLNITQEQLKAGLEKWKTLCIQDAFPELNDGEREFIITGLNPAQWDEIFG